MVRLRRPDVPSRRDLLVIDGTYLHTQQHISLLPTIASRYRRPRARSLVANAWTVGEAFGSTDVGSEAVKKQN